MLSKEVEGDSIMLNLTEINDEIKKLEECETTYPVCKKLAILYTVRNNYKENANNLTPKSVETNSSSKII